MYVWNVTLKKDSDWDIYHLPLPKGNLASSIIIGRSMIDWKTIYEKPYQLSTQNGFPCGIIPSDCSIQKWSSKSGIWNLFQLKLLKGQNPRLFLLVSFFSFLSFFLPFLSLFLDTTEITANNCYISTIQAFTPTWKRHLTEDDYATCQITKSFFWQQSLAAACNQSLQRVSELAATTSLNISTSIAHVNKLSNQSGSSK